MTYKAAAGSGKYIPKIIKHPLRCETCGHHKLVGRIPDIDECDILDHTPTESDKKLIQQIGCASHSSAKSEAVLDKAIAKLDGYYKSLPRGHPYLDGVDLSIQKIEELQEELRQRVR